MGAAPARRPSVAVIVPLWREPSLAALDDLLRENDPDELLLVATDDDAVTRAALDAWLAREGARGVAARRLTSARGRAAQMNRGARAARADVLLFLHADTRLPAAGLAHVREAIARGRVWGRFDVRLSGRRPAYRVIERTMSWRSALTGIATGDQAIFVRRDVFRVLGGFPRLALMEDVALSARLKWVEWPVRLREPVVTSSRRWARDGIARTVLTMWSLRAAYALGVSPRRLARWYK